MFFIVIGSTYALSTTNSSVSLTIKETNGYLLFNGTKALNGTISVYPGNYQIEALPYNGFFFDGWDVVPNSTFRVENQEAANTIVSVAENGVSGNLTPSFQKYTVFAQNGLPYNSVWTVNINGVKSSAQTNTNITFALQNGTYDFSVSNTVYQNETFVPNTKNGTINAGGSLEIAFYEGKTQANATGGGQNITTVQTTQTTTSTTSTTQQTTIPSNQILNSSVSNTTVSSTVTSTINTSSTTSSTGTTSTIQSTTTIYNSSLSGNVKTINLSSTNRNSYMKLYANQISKLIQEAKNAENSAKGSAAKNITFPEFVNTTTKTIDNTTYQKTVILYINTSNGSFTPEFLMLNSSYTAVTNSSAQKVNIDFGDIPANLSVPFFAGYAKGLVGISATLRNQSPESNTIIVVTNRYNLTTIPSTNVSYYFLINSTINDSNIKSANYTFSVNRSWISSQGISPDQVTLLKYSNGGWISLPTNVSSENQTYYTYVAKSDSFSLYAVSYSQAGGVFGDAANESLSLASSYKLYLCSAGANYTFATTGTAVNWTSDEVSPPLAPINGGVNASLGHKTGNVCTAYVTGAAVPGLALAGIGVNAINYVFTGQANTSARANNLTYSVSTSNSFTVILGASGFYGTKSVTLPSGCVMEKWVNNTDTFESAYVALCQQQAAGKYTVDSSLRRRGSSVMGAYVFPPENVIFDDNIPNGEISTAGLTLSSGSELQILGSNSITALPPQNFVFDNWQVSNSVNLTLSSSTSNPATLTVWGAGTVTAVYNGITKFIESGLPSSTEWNVTYNSNTIASSTNTITFSTLPGNYPFSVANQVVNGIIYAPNESSGYVVAGNNTKISFSGLCGVGPGTKVPITLYNNNSAATSAPFQQMLSVNSLEYSQYEANNLDNIEFFYSNCTIVPSWMQGSASNVLLDNQNNATKLYTSTNTIYWLNISNGIGANGAVNLYMGFAPKSERLMNNVNVGEAPELSPSYGEYDDGSKIFNFYDNFAGNAISSAWTVPTGSLYQVDNGFIAEPSGGTTLAVHNANVEETNAIVSEWGINMSSLISTANGYLQLNRYASGSNMHFLGTSGSDSLADNGAGIKTVSIPGVGVQVFGIWNDGTKVTWFYPGGEYTDNASAVVTDYLSLIWAFNGQSNNAPIVYWVRTRYYPPNGAMPSTTFGSPILPGDPGLSFSFNPTIYGANDLITGTAASNGEDIELLNNSNIIAGPSLNSVSYDICGSTPSISTCWAAGSYNIIAQDVGGNSTNAVLTINKAAPSLSLTNTKLVLQGGSATIDYGISSIGNQILANLTLNGTSVSTTYTSNEYTFTPNVGLTHVEVNTSGNKNYTPSDRISDICTVPIPSAFPANMVYYAPICLLNNQSSATQTPFQEEVNISEANYSNYLTYNGYTANFEIFNAIGDVQPSWIENNQSGNLVTWVKINSKINSNAMSQLYIGFGSNALNTLSNNGAAGIGEMPALTSTYGQYDDGASVFNNYFNGFSINGWNVVGTAGQISSAPTGSPFGKEAFYANGINGDYLNTSASGQSTNMIIEYYTHEANLDDVYFLVNSSGAGQMGRVGNGGGWYGIAQTNSWTSWLAPPLTGSWSNEWLLVSIVVNESKARMYVSTTPGLYGTEMGHNPSNLYDVTDKGDFLGLVGDAAGSGTQYWNGMIVRAYPPNDVMPKTLFGGVLPIQSTCTISLNVSSIDFGSVGPGLSVSTLQGVKDTNTGNGNAYIFVYGGNWISGLLGFGVSNTSWSASSNTAYPVANKLSGSPVNTILSVPASGSNEIYFGLNIPPAQQAATYNQVITVENSC